MQTPMMLERVLLSLGIALAVAVLATPTTAASFQLITGQEIAGEPLAPDVRGVIIKRADGSLTERIAWTNFTQTALQELNKALPKAQKVIEPYLIEDEPEPVRKARQEIKFTPPPRLERPESKGLAGLFGSPLSLALLGIIYAASLYAAYEIALFRNYHPALVCGVAAVAPVLGPALFVCLPTHTARPEEFLEPAEQVAHEQAIAAEQALTAHEQPAEEAHGTGHRAAHPPPTVYRRGTTMFNRRFFETKLSGFLRMVPAEADKDMVILVKSARGEHVGQRLSKVLANELCLQINKAGASSEVTIPYADIQEVQVRHKDAA